MDKISQALDAIEAAGAAPSGRLDDTYQSVRPHLSLLAEGLNERGGDHARIGALLGALLAGADSVAGGHMQENTFRNGAQGTVDDGGDAVLTAVPGVPSSPEDDDAVHASDLGQKADTAPVART
jgi:hypothetical protein